MRWTGLLLAIAVLFPVQIDADDLSAAKEKISAAQATYETYSADVDMTLGSGEAVMKSTGAVRGKDQLFAARATVELSGYEQKLIVVRDAAGFLWNEQHEDGAVSITKSSVVSSEFTGFALAAVLNLLEKLRTGPGDLTNVLGAYGKQYDIKRVHEETVNGEKMFVFEGPMRESLREVVDAAAAREQDEDTTAVAETIDLVFRLVGDMRAIRITIAESDGLPRLIEGLRTDDTTSMLQVFRNVTVGVQIDDDEFVYTIPPGEEVIEFL